MLTGFCFELARRPITELARALRITVESFAAGRRVKV
jgi:hypothetical protein